MTCPLGDIPAGATASIDLVTEAADPFPSDGEVVNVAVVAGATSNCAEGSSDPACTDNHPLVLGAVEVDVAEDDRDVDVGAGGFAQTGITADTLVLAAILAIATGVLLRTPDRRRRRMRAS